MSRKTWITIIVGLVIFAVIVGVGLVGGVIYVVSRQVSVQTVSRGGGEQELDRMLASVKDRRPFLELPARDSDSDPVVHHELASANAAPITVLRVRIWSPRDRKLVRMDLPIWLLRLGGNKPMRLRGGEDAFSDVALTVSVEELERRGPGLILDHRNRRGGRLLVWTE